MAVEPTVTTTYGAIRGVRSAGVSAFHAIPYAAPPVGILRFAAPQPPAPWTGLRETTRVGASPPQGPSRLDAVMGIARFAQDEDCLTLTVWTPAADAAKRPVLFWLHGGAYQSGGGSQPFYTGGHMARAGDVVVVSVNYRLGALGYLYVPELETSGGTAANRGLLDQMQALRWVHQNIAAFGGDPANITICGQSAGGGSVLALLADPGSRKLVRRAILQSASAGFLTPERALEINTSFYAAAGLARGDVAALRAMPAADVVAAQRKVQLALAAKGDRSIAYQNVAPSPTCPIAPYKAVCEGAAAGIPLLIGTTLDEGHAWLAQEEALVANDKFDMVAGAAETGGFAKAAGDLPAGRKAKAKRPWELLSAMYTWAIFEKPARRLADAHTAKGGAAWVYRFDWRPMPDARFGACHCIEIPFVFANLADCPPAAMLEGHEPASLARMTSAVQGAWLAFMRAGDPGTPSLPTWPRWDGANKPTMLLDDTCRVEQQAATATGRA